MLVVCRRRSTVSEPLPTRFVILRRNSPETTDALALVMSHNKLQYPGICRQHHRVASREDVARKLAHDGIHIASSCIDSRLLGASYLKHKS